MEDKGDLRMKKAFMIFGAALIIVALLVGWWKWCDSRIITKVSRKPLTLPEDVRGVILMKTLGGDFIGFDLRTWRVRRFRQGLGIQLEEPSLISPDGKKELRDSPFRVRTDVYFLDKGVTLTLAHAVSLQPLEAAWSPNSRYLAYLTVLEDTPWLSDVYVTDLDRGSWWYVLTAKNVDIVWWVEQDRLMESTR